jgi:transcriptional regulator with XRE-family HTH domain
MLSINILSSDELLDTIKANFKQRRLDEALTQEGLANKSGVSLGSVKRFEQTGQISLESLLKIALVLECLDEFKNLGKKETQQYHSIKELMESEKKRKRGKIK